MSTLLIHFISDFLRDSAPAQFGEALRCAVLEDEIAAMTGYGLSPAQQGEIMKRNRAAILARMNAEVGAVMDELDGVLDAFGPAYPSGSVHLRKADVLFDDGAGNKIVRIRGVGMDKKATISFTPKGGAGIPGALISHTCDRDVWQRLHVKAALPAGQYQVTVTHSTNGSSASIDLIVP